MAGDLWTERAEADLDDMWLFMAANNMPKGAGKRQDLTPCATLRHPGNFSSTSDLKSK